MSLNRKISTISLFFLFLLVPVHLFSQETVEVKPSSDKVVIEGKIYYIHIVKPGQTLYSIAKAYNVSEKDIAIENPGVYSGLQISQMLKIPADVPRKEVSDETGKYLQHKLEAKENIYALSRKYNVSVQDIKEANPDLDYGHLSIGQIINIPRSNVVYKDTDFHRHKVRRKETLYGISRSYDISVEDIKKYNPELAWGDLKNGQIIRIPKPGILDEYEETIDSLAFEEVIKDTIPVMFIEDYRDSLIDLSNRKIKVAYLIPFNYKEQQVKDSISLKAGDIEDLSEKNEDPSKTLPWAVNFLEFFEGSLMAIDSMRKEGLSVEVHFFDTQKSPTRMREILKSPFFYDVDLIIGPFYSWNVEIVNEFSKQRRIPVISPFYADIVLTKNNPYMFQMNPSIQTEFTKASEILAKDYDRDFVFIHRAENGGNTGIESFKSSLVTALSRYIFPENVVIKEIIYDNAAKADISADLQLTLSKDRRNVIIIPETEEAFVSTVITQLFFQLKNFNIEVFGMPQFTLFQNVDYKYYHQLGLTYLTPFNISYDDPEVSHFLRKYYSNFKTEPSIKTKKGCPYAFLGYDATFYFMDLIRDYGPDFITHLNDPGKNNLLVNFHFHRPLMSGGFENESMELVRYNEDFSIDVKEALKLSEIPKKEEATDQIYIHHDFEIE